jgi:hypothetical protein
VDCYRHPFSEIEGYAGSTYNYRLAGAHALRLDRDRRRVGKAGNFDADLDPRGRRQSSMKVGLSGRPSNNVDGL